MTNFVAYLKRPCVLSLHRVHHRSSEGSACVQYLLLRARTRIIGEVGPKGVRADFRMITVPVQRAGTQSSMVCESRKKEALLPRRAVIFYLFVFITLCSLCCLFLFFIFIYIIHFLRQKEERVHTSLPSSFSSLVSFVSSYFLSLFLSLFFSASSYATSIYLSIAVSVSSALSYFLPSGNNYVRGIDDNRSDPINITIKPTAERLQVAKVGWTMMTRGRNLHAEESCSVEACVMWISSTSCQYGDRDRDGEIGTAAATEREGVWQQPAP